MSFHRQDDDEKPVNEIDLVERSVCDCDLCKCGCKTMPGFLAPEDVESIAAYLGQEPYESNFLTESFSASEGSIVVDHGVMKQIPTITPKQRPENGHCVFLDDNDRCTIHPVSPFGCRNFSTCDTKETPAESGHKIGIALRAIEQSDDYQLILEELITAECFAKPLLQRKADLLARLLGKGRS